MILLLISNLVFSSNVKIMKDVVSSFSKQCSYIGSVENNIVRKLEENYKKTQEDLVEKAQECYKESITEISSTNFIYQNLCEEVNQKKAIRDIQTLMRLFVSSQKYRKGIRIEHSVLNDCLINADAKGYLVDIDFNKVETKYLRDRLMEIEPSESFTNNRTNVR